MLALPKGDDELNVVYSPFTLSNDYRKKIEPAGKFFEEFVKKYLVSASLDDFLNADAENMIIDEEDTEVYDWEKAYYESIRGESTALSKVKENFYALLGIDDLFLNATVDDIRKAYKKIALIFHEMANHAMPDPMGNNCLARANQADLAQAAGWYPRATLHTVKHTDWTAHRKMVA